MTWLGMSSSGAHPLPSGRPQVIADAASAQVASSVVVRPALTRGDAPSWARPRTYVRTPHTTGTVSTSKDPSSGVRSPDRNIASRSYTTSAAGRRGVNRRRLESTKDCTSRGLPSWVPTLTTLHAAPQLLAPHVQAEPLVEARHSRAKSIALAGRTAGDQSKPKGNPVVGAGRSFTLTFSSVVQTLVGSVESKRSRYHS